MVAPSYIAAAVVVLSQLLPLIGVNVGGEELTTTINTLIAIAGGLVVLWRQIASGRSTIVGGRPREFQV